MSYNRIKGRRIGISIAFSLFAIATCFLYWKVDQDDTRRLFFGMWRLQNVLVGVLLIYFSVARATWIFSRRMTYGYLFATFLLISTIILMELIGLCGIISYPQVFGHKTHQLGTTPQPMANLRGQGYQDLAHTWGYPTRAIPYHYQTDRRGYRHSADRADADIYMVGDSILVAALLPFEKTVTGLLEQSLNRTIANIALVAIGPQQERDLFLEADLPLKNRLVLHYIFEGNDLLDSAAFVQSSTECDLKSDPTHSFKTTTFSYNLMLWFQRLSDRRILAQHRKFGRLDQKDYLFAWTKNSFEGLDDEIDHIFLAIDELNTKVINAGGSYAIVYVPAKIRVLGPLCQWPEESTIDDYRPHLNDLMRQRFTDWCAQRQISMIDLTNPLHESAKPSQIPWFEGDSHPNEIGHLVMANVIKQSEIILTFLENTKQPIGSSDKNQKMF